MKDSNNSKMKNTLVMKFGGAAVKTPERFKTIAEVILDRLKEYSKIAVVVSAMGDTTDDLHELALKVNPEPPQRELDMLISVGERISTSLLAMALANKGKTAISFTGSQAGIITTDKHNSARILAVRPHRLTKQLDNGNVVIVAGFQGMSTGGEITTLGRGGSDTSAVAIAVALQATKVEFFKDVEGIFESDPRENPDAQKHDELSYENAWSLVSSCSHQVLQERSIRLAQKNGIPLHVIPFHNYNDQNVGTWIGDRTRNYYPEDGHYEEE